MFVGREAELAELEGLYAKRNFQFAVVYGRRRVGKTTLLSHFAEGRRTLFYTALEQSNEGNLSDFSRAAGSFFGLGDALSFESWRAAFDFIAERAAKERFVLVFDEFPYAAKRDASLPSVLQVVIDHKLQDTSLFLILCGSNQGFMESEVLGRKSPLYGRRTAQFRIRPLGYRDAALMLPEATPHDAFRFYACIGGVPYYLSQVETSLSFRENIGRLFFRNSGFLYGEPELLLRQELSDPATYNSILRAIAGGATRPRDIAGRSGIGVTSLPRYLTTLVDLDLIERRVPFGENPETSRKAAYHVREAAFAFWFRFVMPRVAQVEEGAWTLALSTVTEADLNTYLGYRFELVCREWLLQQAIAGELPLAVDRFGSWWGTNPTTRETTDIDVLAASSMSKRLIIGECKYREDFDETAAMRQLEERASLVKGYATEHYYLFTKHAPSKGTLAKIAARDEWHAMTLDGLYR